MRLRRTGAAAAALFISFAANALDRVQLERLASDDNDEKIAAIGALAAEGDPRAAEVLRSAAEGEIEIDGRKLEIVVNNRVRGRIQEALSVLKLLSEHRHERLEAAKALAGGADPAMLPLVKKALEREAEAEIRSLLEITAAGMQLKSEDKAVRLAAIRAWPDRTTRRSFSRPRPTRTRRSAWRRRGVCARSTVASHGGSGSASRSPARRSARSCCSPRSASRLPTA